MRGEWWLWQAMTRTTPESEPGQPVAIIHTDGSFVHVEWREPQVQSVMHLPVYRAPEMPSLTDDMIQAAENYLNIFPNRHPLPAQWRWHDLWHSMMQAHLKGTPK